MKTCFATAGHCTATGEINKTVIVNLVLRIRYCLLILYPQEYLTSGLQLHLLAVRRKDGPLL